MNLLDRIALAAIVAYQRHLSPRKGFCCAHRAQHGGPSCSEYARQTLTAYGLRQTLPLLLRQRLRACQAAARALIADQNDDRDSRKKRRDCACDLPNACPTDLIPDSCDGGGCIPDSCARLGVRSLLWAQSALRQPP
ncbi:MAG: membrane protein insertion efficiency factor YidD [Synechococcaceae cyanobacterium SM1_2_3]|nr:membrane protein insertion efficiency factor YidD [Synechococcaceae cyanobacterium SM1_2_3]